MEYSKSNGLIHDSNVLSAVEYPLFQEEDTSKDSYRNEAMRHMFEPNPVNDLFFSDVNISTLQDAIRYLVYKRSGHVVGKQSDTELKVIMRSVYLQYSKNMRFKVVEQVRDLNKIVLDYCVPNIVANVKQHIGYYNNSTKLPIPMEHSKSSSSAGLKTLILEKF